MSAPSHFNSFSSKQKRAGRLAVMAGTRGASAHRVAPRKGERVRRDPDPRAVLDDGPAPHPLQLRVLQQRKETLIGGVERRAEALV